MHKIWKLWRENDEKIGYEVISKFSKASTNDENDLQRYFQVIYLYFFQFY